MVHCVTVGRASNGYMRSVQGSTCMRHIPSLLELFSKWHPFLLYGWAGYQLILELLNYGLAHFWDDLGDGSPGHPEVILQCGVLVTRVHVPDRDDELLPGSRALLQLVSLFWIMGPTL